MVQRQEYARSRLTGTATEMRTLTRAFAKDERGVTAVIFAICFVAIFAMIAIAVDYGFASLAKMRQQAALDAATMAASEKLGLPDEQTAGKAIANTFYKANTRPEDGGEIGEIVLDATQGEVRALGMTDYLTSLLNGINVSKLRIGTGTKIVRGLSSAEIALVLDNSGSMAGQPLADLKSAAEDLLDIVFVGTEGTERMRIGIVPFAGSVNVGAAFATSDWIDKDAASPVHRENLEAGTNKTRFQLFDDLGVAWAGCVEARPSPYDVQDVPVMEANGATFFVPMFAPDEPDADNDDGASYSNNYLVDDGGACTPQPQTCTGGYSRRGNCRGWTKEPLAPAVAQSRVCKYSSATFSGAGPNAGCTTSPILPLTSTKSQIQSAISAMQASGNTNIGEGVMWGLRVVSPSPPFTEGREYDAERNRKIIVLMTDGQNTYSATSNHNKSTYGAFAYGIKNRLGSNYQSAEYRNQMNIKTQVACSAAKAAGITIYTIAFRLETDPVTTSLLGGCASSSDKALTASNGTALVEAFRQIGRDISSLRIAG